MVSQCRRQFLFIALFFIIANQAACRKLHELTMEERHEQWMVEHGKVYTDGEEKQRRLQIFKHNVEFIESFNAAGNKTYKLGINKFADLTNKEFRASFTGFKIPRNALNEVTTFKYENVTAPPSSVDWRKKNVVTSVKDQGDCGCCWAISAVGAIEGVHKQSKGKLISLSPQELVDCDVKGEDHGCKGGYMNSAFKFVINMHGITSETNYPYNGKDGHCNHKKANTPVAKISKYESVPANSEEALLKAVANQPVAVAVDGGSMDFQFYKDGILTDCGTDLNHGVLAVGYGVGPDEDNDKINYWLVKNSWGLSWGEKGYIRLERGIKAKGGLCGIAKMASYPVA